MKTVSCYYCSLLFMAFSWKYIARSYSLGGVSTIAFIVVFLILHLQEYQGSAIGQHDPYRCRALLQEGRWSPSHPDSHKWEPSGCRMIEYSRKAFHECLNRRKVVFAGDSIIRQIFWAAAKRLDRGRAERDIGSALVAHGQHHDLSFEADGVSLEFIWDPWLNSTTLDERLTTFRTLPTPVDEGVVRSEDEESAALILVGSPGLWAARYGEENYLILFRQGIMGIAPHLSSTLDDSISSSTFSPGSYDNVANQILLAPVHIPSYNNLSSNRSRTITPERIHKMNNYLAHLPPKQLSHIPWVYNQMSTAYPGNYFDDDGLHVADNIAERKLDIALNTRCNAAAKAHNRSFKGTCCVTESQSVLKSSAWWLWGLMMYCRIATPCFSTFKRRIPLFVNGTKAIGDLLFALLWCVFCDGTNRISKVERHYQQNQFIRVCLLWLVGSLLTVQRSGRPSYKYPMATKRPREEPLIYRGPGYLSRDQSDEIKGLMQGLILLYHYNYASQTLWVYKIVRLLISMYFFLSGYGHTLYFLERNDYSLRRVVLVLFRLNLLSALLPYAMGTDYSSYYFASVITFWYLVLYATLRFYRSYNCDLRYLFTKIIVAAAITDRLISTPGILEGFVRVTHTIFHMSWNAQELRFRLSLDRYIVYAGIIVAALVHYAAIRQAHKLSFPLGGRARPHHRRSRSSPLHPRNKHILLNTVCAAATIAFFYATQTQLHRKQHYNHVHPFVSWIPIVGLVVLRNGVGGGAGSEDVFRRDNYSHYLALPAALRRFSLETYVLQYHVWLGGDATARLRLGCPGAYGWVVDKVLLTVLFVYVAERAHRATSVLAGWVTPRGGLVLLLGLWGANVLFA
ncbi:10 TM acyl transferase domain found in Cas1p-domain-containing protein [Whalleya microplaca]|nr:10 TM acyl transferase domain found in Cas1p-domain-containing protein [Whalleya microplaca]